MNQKYIIPMNQYINLPFTKMKTKDLKNEENDGFKWNYCWLNYQASSEGMTECSTRLAAQIENKSK